ncbi:hypothetical protein NB644_09380 [Oxalobacter formigenes]|uniref:hypothetical protein n=1 Tax=Oxalobacter formigenes TaxID=847 RepID=UPI0022B04F75|nr:hypothetical protein [Oxalobacter formigenes]WAW01146.1 hypothetical protein NB644_09380 [Oxalobacter formigenes]WAW03474.1 hypothetical protein NB642_10150 [Oxalobacter formigenes]
MSQQFSKKERSITQKLKRAWSKERLSEISDEWIAAWEKEQTGLIDRLGIAVAKDDFDEQSICVGELRKITEKRFTGLKNGAIEIIGRIDDDKNSKPGNGRN